MLTVKDKVDLAYKQLRDHVDTQDDSRFNTERYLLAERSDYVEAFIRGDEFPPFEAEIQMSSSCNLECSWCIGAEVQRKKQVLNLPNAINEENVDRIVDGILDYRVNGLGIETVKFSGFIGEPLVRKAATIKAIQRFVGAGLRVGLFTNGVLLTKDTWQTVANLDYVHVSLDGGPMSFPSMKIRRSENYDARMYHQVLANINGLRETRDNRGRSVKINIGYVVVPGNHFEIYDATRDVKHAGADMIRFKCDIVGEHDLRSDGVLDVAYEQIDRTVNDFHEPPAFTVYPIHSREDIEQASYSKWQCSDGCHFQHFMSTIGSNGDVYLCDHNTMPGGSPLGNAIDQNFSEVWRSAARQFLADGVGHICRSDVCPPFGNRANQFLQQVVDLREKYGSEAVILATRRICDDIAASKPAGRKN